MRKLALVLVAVLVAGSFSVSAGELKVNTSKSELKWLGKKVTGEHHGTINIKDGSLEVSDGNITGGTFKIDMSSIVVQDLTGGMKDKLEGHLKSDDFFGVETYPTAKLIVTKATPFKNGSSEVEGNLTIKAATHPISFVVKKSDNVYETSIVVDRSLYDVRYGSGKFFDNLGDKTIYDDFTLDVKLVVE